MSLAQKLFGFQGRLRRRDWWLFATLLVLLYLVLIWAGIELRGANQVDLRIWFVQSIEVQAVVALILLWPTSAVSAKRLHDRGRSGRWLALLFGLYWAAQGFTYYRLRFLSAAIASPGQNLLGLGLFLAMAVVAAWMFLELGLLGGAPGPNRFGDSPKTVG